MTEINESNWEEYYPNLKGANLKGAYLEYVDLQGADLENADLEGAYIDGANFDNANLKGANLTECHIDVEGWVSFEGANLENAILKDFYRYHQDVRDRPGKPMSFTGANLKNINVEGADLSNSNFYECLNNQKLREELDKIKREGRSGAEIINESNWKEYYPNLKGANLENADLRGANLENADLKGAKLQGAKLRLAYCNKANLEGAYLEGANLGGAYLKGAKLYGAYFYDAILDKEEIRRGAELINESNWKEYYPNLKGANLKGANLKNVNLQEADLRGADLENADLEGSYIDDVWFDNANLKGANLSECYIDFQGYLSFKGANMENVILKDFYRNYEAMDKPGTPIDFIGANLKNINVEGAELDNSNFYECFDNQ